MLIDLYGRTQIDATHGMPLEILKQFDDTSETCRKLLETGVHALWSLTLGDRLRVANWPTPYLKKKSSEDFLTRVHLLQNIGALWFEPWVFSNDRDDAEPLFPVGTVDPTLGKFTLSEQAMFAAVLLAADRPNLVNPRADSVLVIFPVHHTPPSLRGVAKLRVEADTPGRRAAYGARSQSIRFWHGEYERLNADLKMGRTDRPIRTAALAAE
jgi:hypothetical protein